MNVLITGGSGLLGSHAAMAFRHRHTVHSMVRQLPAQPIPGVTYHVADLSSHWSAQILPEKMDVIFHLAQSSRFREFPEQAGDVFDVNVTSTARLLDYARKAGARRFVLASSGGIYGTGKEAFRENAAIPHHGELGYYLATKLCAEVLAQNYAPLLDVTVLRFFFMYGAGQKRSMLMPRLVDKIRAGQAVTLQGETGLRINPIHVFDAVAALDATLRLQGSQTFNVAGAQTLSLREVASIIGDAVGHAPVFRFDDSAPRDLVADIEAMREHLVQPAVPLVRGIRDLIV